MSKFWEKVESRDLKSPSDPTIVVVSSEDSEGSIVKELRDLDSADNPLNLLSYTDFQLSELIKKSISYNSLNITSDMRLGHESEFAELERRFTENSAYFV